MNKTEQNSREAAQGFWQVTVNKIKSLLGLEREERRPPSQQEWKAIAEDIVKESGLMQAVKQYAKTDDPEERRLIKTDWEKKMSERKARSYSQSGSTEAIKH